MVITVSVYSGMSIREVVPGDRGGEAVQGIASLFDAFALVSIEPFGPDNPELAGLPERPDTPAPDPLSVTQLSVAQSAYDRGVEALGLIKHLEDVVAGTKARLVARVAGAAGVEAKLLCLDGWQHGLYASSAVMEIALTLGIPERTAAGLEHHSTTLVQERPRVLAALDAGTLSWRHATIIDNEIQTLQETADTTAEDVLVLETRLLTVAESTTASSFTGKARRERERMHPETITTRTKEDFSKRKLTCDSGKDGMSWLTLHLPTIRASAIYTHCTRVARALKADAARAQREADKSCTGQDFQEHRTLDQLRADIAAILLMGQALLAPTRPDLPINLPVNATTTGSHDDQHGTGAADTTHGADPTAAGFFGSGAPSSSHRPAAWPWGSTNAGVADHCMDEEPPWAHSGTCPACDAADVEDAADAAEDANAQKVPAERRTGPQKSHPVTGQGPALPTVDLPPMPQPMAYVPPMPRESGAGQELAVDQPGGDGSGLVGWTVDGIAEDPQGDYGQQLAKLATSRIMIDPPLPEALVIVTVPFLGLLGITDEPAELAGPEGGPIPAGIARKLLTNSFSFLRVLTDPITGESLPLDPQRYTLRAAEKPSCRPWPAAATCRIAPTPSSTPNWTT